MRQVLTQNDDDISLLQHDLSTHLIDIETIENFVAEVVDGVGQGDESGNGAEHALQMLR